MTKYHITIKASAVKYLSTIPKKDRLRIVGVIELLSENPLPPKALKLRGRDGYRIRVGTYRIIYSFKRDELIISIIKIGHRKEIYDLDG